ncbi:MAG: STAS domain-containing protein [Phycisphaeraceae bacterium]|nr:STAS domain-containing protein [Phycisphaeraceae bacterium]
MRGLDVRTERYGSADGPVIARVMGDVGVNNADRLATLLRDVLAIKPRLIVLDLSETSGVGSMALGVLVQFSKVCKREGLRMRIAAPSQSALQGILLSRLDSVLEVFATLDDALDGESACNGPVRMAGGKPASGTGTMTGTVPTSGEWQPPPSARPA